jgi:hypothetical protein
MAEIYTVLETANANGTGAGLFHWVSYSDEAPEHRRIYHRVTDIVYRSEQEALACPIAAAELDRVFGQPQAAREPIERRLWKLRDAAEALRVEMNGDLFLNAAKITREAAARLEAAAMLMGYSPTKDTDTMSDKVQTVESARAGMVGAADVSGAKPEPNFPGYKNPAGTTPGQRAGSTPERDALVERVRAWRREGIALLHDIGQTDPAPGHRGRFGSAELTHAKTNAMLAEFYAIFHITGGPD